MSVGREYRRFFWPEQQFWQYLTTAFSFPVLALIRLYQQTISKQISSRQCRYNPTCSQYAYEAIARYGLTVGGSMAYKRILRCNPGQPAGSDPVP